MLDWFLGLISDFCNYMIELFASTLAFVANLLPTFSISDSVASNASVYSQSADFFAMINWLIPFGQILAVFVALYGAYFSFYVFTIILRWLKVLK